MVNAWHGSMPTMVEEGEGGYAARLCEAMVDKFDVPGLASAMGLSRQAVKKVVDGETAYFKVPNHYQAADALEVNARWLGTGEGSKTDQEQAFSLSLARALERIAKALSAEMPPAIREDAAYLLFNLAKRHGEARHQTELITLLESVHVGQKSVSPPPSSEIDRDLVKTISSVQDESPSNKLGGSSEQPDGGNQWAPPTNIGERVNREDRKQGDRQDTYPGKTPKSKTGRGRA